MTFKKAFAFLRTHGRKCPRCPAGLGLGRISLGPSAEQAARLPLCDRLCFLAFVARSASFDARAHGYHASRFSGSAKGC